MFCNCKSTCQRVGNAPVNWQGCKAVLDAPVEAEKSL